MPTPTRRCLRSGAVSRYASTNWSAGRAGPIACTTWSHDLFWVAVDPAEQGRGLGRSLMTESERLIREAGGRRVYVETSGQEQYRPTRAFYERCGYALAAELPEFYGPDDAKVVYVKTL